MRPRHPRSRHGSALTVAAVVAALSLVAAFASGLVAAQGIAPIRAEEPLVPLSNVEGKYVCFPKQHLYERGGIHFCAVAADPARWPKRVRYAILGADVGRFEPQIAAAVAEAHRITGAQMVRSGTPDLIIVLETEILDATQIRAMAAKADVLLSDTDVDIIRGALRLNVRPVRYGSGGSVGAGWTHDAMIAYFDARRRPGTDDKDFAASIAEQLRKYVLSFFGIEPPLQGFICSRDSPPVPGSPTEIDQGTDGLTCPAEHLLMQSGGETFCARPIPYWPRTITYAAIGPQADAHAPEIAAAAARLARLTGRPIIAGGKPTVMIALVDRPFDEADLRAALAKARVATPPDDTTYLMTSVSTALYRATPAEPTRGVRTEYCVIELQQVIRTDGRPPEAIRKDIDDTFSRILEITPPIRRGNDTVTKP